MNRNGVEIIGRIVRRKLAANVQKSILFRLVFARIENLVFLENHAVVKTVEPRRNSDEIRPRIEFINHRLLLDQFVFEKTNKNQPVERARDGFSQIFAG